MVAIRHGAASDTGLVREGNEDSWYAGGGLFVVADGMGGHQDGEVASSVAVDAFEALARSGRTLTAEQGAELVLDALGSAHERLRELARTRLLAGEGDWSAGTTVVAALLVHGDDGPAWLVANLGDSRAYGLTSSGLVQVSIDHSVVQQLVDAGAIAPEDAAHHPERNVLTRALSAGPLVAPDFFAVPVADCERLLLCSDGISDLISAQAIADLLAGAEDAQAAADVLVDAALAAGGHDNATALVVEAV